MPTTAARVRRIGWNVALAVWLAAGAALAGEERQVELSRAERPGLFFSAEDLPSLRTKMQAPPTREMWQWTQRFCDRLLTRPYQPPRPGSYYEDLWDRSHAVEGLAFAFVLTEDPRYLQRARQEIEGLLECDPWAETDSAGRSRPVTVDRVTGRVAFSMAVAYDWLYRELGPELRQRIRQATRQRAIEPVIAQATRGREGWLTWYRGNWGLGTYAQIGTAALAFAGEEDAAPQWLAFARGQLQRYLEAGGRDGGWGEGCQYFAVGWNPACKFAWALRRATGGRDDMLQHPFLQRLADFPLYFLLPDRQRYVTFGNCNVGPSASTSLLVMLATVHRNPHAQWLAAEGHDGMWGTARTIFAHIAYDPGLEARLPSDLPLAKHFRGIDWAVMRSGWDSPDDVFFAFKGGTGDWDHIHGDFNSFVLHAYGSPLLVDLGYVREVWGCRSEAHNTIRVAGQDQFPRTRPAGGAREPERFCKLRQFVHTDFYDHLVGDATAAYDRQQVQRFTREVMYFRPDLLIVFDRVLTHQPLDVEWTVHTFGDLEVDGDVVRVSQDQAAVDITVVAPRPWRYEVFTKSWAEAGIAQPLPSAKADTFIKLRPVEASRETCFLTVLHPRRRDADPDLQVRPLAADGAAGVAITRGGSTATALFALTPGGIDAAGFQTDARACAALVQDGRLAWAALHQGSHLSRSDQPILDQTGEKPDSLLYRGQPGL